MYYDLLPKLKNAEMAQKETVYSGFSKMDFAILKILAQYKFVKEVQKKTAAGKNVLEVKLAGKKNDPAISEFKIMSKPSRRLYMDYRNLRPVRQKFGIAVLSTSKGIMSNIQARKQKVGGEYLFEI